MTQVQCSGAQCELDQLLQDVCLIGFTHSQAWQPDDTHKATVPRHTACA